MIGFALLVLFFLVVAFVFSNILNLIWMLILQVAAMGGLLLMGYILYYACAQSWRRRASENEEDFQ